MSSVKNNTCLGWNSLLYLLLALPRWWGKTFYRIIFESICCNHERLRSSLDLPSSLGKKIQLVIFKIFNSFNIFLLKLRSVIEKGGEDESFITGYRPNIIKTILCHFVSIMLCGIPYLLAHWKPKWRLSGTSSICPLWQAEK